MTTVVLVDRAADAPDPRPGTTVAVVDPAWTPAPGDRPDLVPVRPVVEAVLADIDVIDRSLEVLDEWAERAGAVDAFAVDGATYWFHARMLIRWEVHELLLWRLVLDRLAPAGAALEVATARPALRAAASLDRRRRDVTGARLRWYARRGWLDVRLLVRDVLDLGQAIVARSGLGRRELADAARRLDAVAAGGAGVLALVWPQAYHVVDGASDAGSATRSDPYLQAVIDRLRRDGERVTVVGLGVHEGRAAGRSLLDADPGLLPEHALRIWHRRTVRRHTGAVLGGGARAPMPALGHDVGPAIADLVQPYLGRWLQRQAETRGIAARLLERTRPTAMLLDREGSRTGWLAAARRRRVRSVAVQHGMIYGRSPEYWRPGGRGLAPRPDATCVFGDAERQMVVGEGGYDPATVFVTGSPRMPRLPAVGDGSPDAGDGRDDRAETRRAVRADLGVADGDRLLAISVAHNPVLGELHTFSMLARLLDGPLPGVHLAIKLHPQDEATPRHRELLAGLATAGGYAPAPLSVIRDIDIYRLLVAADAHLGHLSTVLSDAVIAGTPNMLAACQARSDPLGYVAGGVAVRVRTTDDVRAFMADPRPPSPEAREAFLARHYRAGDAAGRIAEIVRTGHLGPAASTELAGPPAAVASGAR